MSVIRILVRSLIVLLFALPLGAAVLQVLVDLGASSGAPGSGLGPFHGADLLGPAFLPALQFTLGQSLLSTFVALVLGMPGAWLLGRLDFRGRGAYAILSTIPFVFPPVLFVLGFTGIWGNNGAVNRLLALIPGLPEPALPIAYSYPAVVLAHGLFNFPLVSGMVAMVWKGLSPSLGNAARMLGASGWRAWRTVTLPALMPGIGAAASLVFLYCFMSFTIPLCLGGGPRFATMEVLVYTALNAENNPGRAALLALVEFVAALFVLLAYAFLIRRLPSRSTGLRSRPRDLSTLPVPARIAARIWLVFSTLLALTPLAALFGTALVADTRFGGEKVLSFANFSWLITHGPFWSGMLNALLVAVASAGLACLLALAAVQAIPPAAPSNGARARSMAALLPLTISPLLLTLGYLVLFRQGAKVPILVLVQASMSWPLAYRTLLAHRESWSPSLHQAAAVLGASPVKRFLTVDVPLLRPALGVAFAMSAALSLGDVNIPLMLGVRHLHLPAVQAYDLMGAYQFGKASALGIIIAILAGLAFWSARKLDKGDLRHVP